MATSQSDWRAPLVKLEKQLELYLVDKAPAIPKEWRELLVKIAPWISLVMVIIAVPAVLAIFGMAAWVSSFAYLGGVGYSTGFTISWIFTLMVMALQALAIPGLFKRTKAAWNLLFYATLLTAVQNLVVFNLAGLIIGTLISLYILFQVKEYYK